MKSLIYGFNTSVDGFIEDAGGDFSWGVPNHELYEVVNRFERPVGIILYGRRMYETMAVWETAHLTPDEPAFSPGLGPLEHDYANHWRSAEKIVFSRTLGTVSTARTRIEPAFDPAAVRKLKEQSTSDLEIGGAELAGHAIRAGLVDEFHQLVHPVILGGGKPWLPRDVVVKLELVSEHRFATGVLHLHYRRKS